MAEEIGAQGQVPGPQAAPGAAVPFGGTVTIFFSDIRGFTDYTEQSGDEAAYRILREHNAIVRKQIEAFGGVVVKTQGDSFMVAFTTARGAILCAVATQRAIGQADRNHTGPRIAIGVGINTGEPIQEGGDYFGSMVNLAARICAATGPGQILIAETTRDVAGRIESVEYVDRGLHELKGFPEAKRLCEVVWRPAEAREATEGRATPAAAAEDTAALTTVVQRAIGLLNRVLGLTHLDDPAFGPLIECQAKASELRVALSRALSERRNINLKQAQDLIVPFENLMTLVLEGATLGEQRWAQLDASVARTFGRPLVTAAARGRISAGTAEKPAPAAAAPADRRPEPAPSSRVPVVETPNLPPLDPRAAGVRWWSRAYTAWSQWKMSGVGLAHAIRGELGKHSHLLSVHIQDSADQEVADGYFLLLEHVESQSPGFLRTVVERALGRSGGASEPEVLGTKLYETLVEGGRLRDTYGTMVRDVMGIAIPHPGVWADGGVIENDGSTVAVMRPSGFVGDPAERNVELTDLAERMADHSFTMTVEPLTARFFFVKPGELKTPHDLQFKLTVDGHPSDKAWYLTLRMSLLVRSEPKLLPKDGVSLPGLGKDHGGAWIGVFNPNPDAAASYELVVGLRPPPRPTLGQPAAPTKSPFSPPPPSPR